jgi:signal transduction histidine kinase
LSNVQILNELALRNLEDPVKSASFMQKVREDLQRINEALSDIVWNVNPRNDDLPTLFIRMKRYAADAFDGKDIHYTLDFPAIGSSVKMKMEKRRDFYLVFKECVNNLVKYSGATQATVKIEIREKMILLDVADNGKGFDLSEITMGNGLYNMRQRAKSSGGKLAIESTKGTGTAIRLEIPLKGNYTNG